MSSLPRLTTKSDAFINLDALRFIAAAGVMLFHAAHFLDLGPSYDSTIFSPLRFLVDLFFAISGFVIGFSYLERVGDRAAIKNFFRGRFAYIYPLHFATFLGALAIGIIGAGQTNNPQNYDLRCIPANILLGQAWGLCGDLSFNFPSWSLSAEVMMYALFPLFALLARRLKWVIPAGSLLAFALLTYVSSFTDRPWYEWTAPSGSLRALPSFLFGLSLWLYRDVLVSRVRGAHVLLYSSLLLSIVLIATRANDLLIVVNVYLIAFFACASDLQMRRTAVAKFIAPMGSLTMEIYLLHNLIFIALLTVLSKRLLHLEGIAMNAAVALSFLIVVASSYVAKFAYVDPMKRRIMAWRRTAAPHPTTA